jgi:hypothetical protein
MPVEIGASGMWLLERKGKATNSYGANQRV